MSVKRVVDAVEECVGESSDDEDAVASGAVTCSAGD